MDSNFRFRAFLAVHPSSRYRVRVLPKGPTPNRGPKPSPSSGKNWGGSRSLSAAHDPKLVAFPVYTSVGPSNVSRIFSSTLAPTNAFPWRKPDAIHRRYLET